MCYRTSAPYHLQANGHVESTNKNLEGILTKTMQLHKKDWDDRLPKSFWAYGTTQKYATCLTPCDMVYGKKVLFPIEFHIKTYKTIANLGMNLEESQKETLLQLNQLDEMRQDAFQHISLLQQQRELWHDWFIKKKHFQEGDWALLYDF